jgi:NAD(P)-dependent dehydrogenase (short-subunit alcohol dehydrogenase family)
MTGMLEGKVALVTGGASGIGRAAARVFAREGAAVALADVNVEGGERAAREVEEGGGRARFLRADVSSAAEVEALVQGTVAAFGGLDCAFNNAGVEGAAGPIAESTEENWDRVVEINLKGVWLCMKHEVARMLRQGGGAIVNTSSIMGLVACRDNPAYAATKHGVVGLTRSAALDYARSGIRVNAVCPGYVRTPMLERLFEELPDLEEPVIARHPLGRLAAPEEIAEAVAWLCSDRASFVTGHIMPVDGGYVAQ